MPLRGLRLQSPLNARVQKAPPNEPRNPSLIVRCTALRTWLPTPFWPETKKRALWQPKGTPFALYLRRCQHLLMRRKARDKSSGPEQREGVTRCYLEALRQRRRGALGKRHREELLRQKERHPSGIFGSRDPLWNREVGIPADRKLRFRKQTGEWGVDRPSDSRLACFILIQQYRTHVVGRG